MSLELGPDGHLTHRTGHFHVTQKSVQEDGDDAVRCFVCCNYGCALLVDQPPLPTPPSIVQMHGCGLLPPWMTNNAIDFSVPQHLLSPSLPAVASLPTGVRRAAVIDADLINQSRHWLRGAGRCGCRYKTNAKRYFLNHQLWTILGRLYFVFLFHQQTEQPHQGNMNNATSTSKH